MNESHTVVVQLQQQQDYRFDIEFGADLPVLTSDKPAPLGTGLGPEPIQLLCAAVGNCLSDSLLFALRKFKQAPEPLSTTVEADVGRNPEGHIRILGLRIALRLGVPAARLEHLDRVLASFEGYCTVTQSVKQGIPVAVTVQDADGVVLKA